MPHGLSTCSTARTKSADPWHGQGRDGLVPPSQDEALPAHGTRRRPWMIALLSDPLRLPPPVDDVSPADGDPDPRAPLAVQLPPDLPDRARDKYACRLAARQLPHRPPRRPSFRSSPYERRPAGGHPPADAPVDGAQDPDDEGGGHVCVLLDADGTFQSILAPPHTHPETTRPAERVTIRVRLSDFPAELRKALTPLVPCQRDEGGGRLVFTDVVATGAAFRSTHHCDVLFDEERTAAVVGEALRLDRSVARDGATGVQRWISRMCTSVEEMRRWVQHFTRRGSS